jgi:AcrR family transcriptional regulator
VLYITDISTIAVWKVKHLYEAATTETQKKLLSAGKAEFLSKGFKSASLRKIAKDAGFTLGAFYGYYQSKEALFDALAAPAAEGLMLLFKASQDDHFGLINKNETSSS